ncbi:MAG: EamA family transporter [Alphaproteobacteria bacterium]|nr:EamA family transporter [Alphaproteobacteria bacterium]
MELPVAMAVLCAALLHAVWNSLLKGGKDSLLDSMVLALSCSFVCLLAIPFVPVPDAASWPFAAASVAVHCFYLFFLSKSYQHGNFGAVYPVIRGLPPLIVVVASSLFLKEDIHFFGWVGIFLVSSGILVLGMGRGNMSGKALALSVMTALSISSYTVTDGMGARLSGDSTGFLVWISFLYGLVFSAFVVKVRTKAVSVAHIKAYWRRGSIGGVVSLIAYGIVLWAMTKAPIAYVSALRETSVLFGGLIAVLFLGEAFKKSRILSATLIVCGVAVMRLGW